MPEEAQSDSEFLAANNIALSLCSDSRLSDHASEAVGTALIVEADSVSPPTAEFRD
jgi:hypothetical protein